MQSDTFECKNIYKAFINEYLSSSFLGWDVFIKREGETPEIYQYKENSTFILNILIC